MSDRKLLTFAYVAEAYSTTGDLASGLAPLFAPVVAKRAGQAFDPGQFAKDCRALYDLEMHPYVAEELAPYLAAHGLLKEVVAANKADVTYIHLDIPDNGLNLKEEDLQSLSERFITFASNRLAHHGLSEDPSALADALFQRLTRMEFIAILAKADSAKVEQKTLSLYKPAQALEISEDKFMREAHLDSLCAAFIKYLNDSDAEGFNLLSRIAEGALLAEVITELQTPLTKNDGLSGLTIYLDGPILLDLLNLSDQQQTDYARLLLEKISVAGLNVATFSHCVDEAKNAIQSVLDNINIYHDAWGPLGVRASRDLSVRAYARSILSNFEEELARQGISVFSWPKHYDPAQIKFFTGEDEAELSQHIGMYRNAEAKLRDARSVADVLRLRKTAKASSIYNCEQIFLTRNPKLAAKSMVHLVKVGKVGKTYFPPCISDKHFAGLLWIILGGGGASLPRAKLIANCSAALTPRLDVMKRVSSFLSKTDSEKQRQFDALMTNDRAANFLTQATLSDAALVTPENVEALYERVEEIAGEKARIEANEKMAALRSAHAAEVDAMNNAKAFHDAEQALKLDLTKSNLGEALSSIQALERKQEEERHSLIERCMSRAKRKASRISVIVWLLLGCFELALIISAWTFDKTKFSEYQSARYALLGLALAGGLYAFLEPLRLKWISTKVTSLRQQLFLSDLTELGIEKHLENYSLDWEACQAKKL